MTTVDIDEDGGDGQKHLQDGRTDGRATRIGGGGARKDGDEGERQNEDGRTSKT